MTNAAPDDDALAQAERVRTGEVSPLELVDDAIARIEKLDPQINAVIHRRFEKAREEAKGPLPDGPFRGVPLLIKDLYADSAGDPQHDGMKALKDAGWTATADTWLVARYRKAGFVIVGRTNTPELGLVPTTEPVAYGATHNPWDLTRTPGGSSGGSAAAVAARMVAVAHASDGGGSIRIPASMCGLVGLKPSRGRMSLGPYGDESGLSVQHAVTTTVRDTAAMLDATHGPGPGDMTVAPPPARRYVEEVGADPGKLRIGFLAARADDDCLTAVRNTAKQLEALGHHVEEAHPAALDDNAAAGRFFARWCTNARLALARQGEKLGRQLTEEDVEPATWFMASLAANFSALDLAQAIAASARYTRDLASWWADGWDVLLTPTLGGPPPKLGALDFDPADPAGSQRPIAELVPFTTHFNVSGQPAISVPLHENADRLPIGVQLVAAYGREDLLLRVASKLEAAHPWADRRPSVAD
jgi:amidase